MTVAMLERIARALRVDIATLIKADGTESELLPTELALAGREA